MTKILSLSELAADPAAIPDQLTIYSKDVGGVTQLFGRASDGAVYQLTPSSPYPTTPPGTYFNYYDDFITSSGARFVTDSGTPSTGLANSSDPYIRLARISTDNPNDGAFMEVGDAQIFGNFLPIGGRPTGRLLVEWGGSIADLSPTLASDFTARFLASTLMSSSILNGNGDGFGFSLGLAQNGNANLWGFLNDASKVDLGVINDTDFHRYRVVYTFGVGTEWFLDDAPVGSIAGASSADGLTINLGMNLRSDPGASALPGMALDYIWVNYAYTRPA